MGKDIPPLVDPFGRGINYLRVSITDRCDMRCSYCMPVDFKGFEIPRNWLTVEESTRLVHLFADLGVSKVRITGGEPLLRRDVIKMAEAYRSHGLITDLSLSTNGSSLLRLARPLHQAGVQRLNVSLDSLDAQRYKELTKRDVLQTVLDGIDAARHEGFEVIKLNMVVRSDTLVDEIESMVQYARSRRLILRLIEPMPMGDAGRSSAGMNLTQMGSQLAIRHKWIRADTAGHPGPARYWVEPSSGFSLGIISPMSQHFCDSCNRVRLTVDGRLLLCLGHEDSVPLGQLMRSGASDAELIDAIRAGVGRKPERHHFVEHPEKLVRFMSATGG